MTAAAGQSRRGLPGALAKRPPFVDVSARRLVPIAVPRVDAPPALAIAACSAGRQRKGDGVARAGRVLLVAVLVLTALGVVAAPADVGKLEADRDWAAVLGIHLAVLETDPGDSHARYGAWRAAMRLGLFEQAAALGAGLSAQEAAAMEGDRIALAIRHGRIDARTLAGEARYGRLDEALAATDALALHLQAGRLPDGEERRRLLDRVAALAARNRHAAAVELYELLLANGIDVPAWALADVAGAYLAQRQPRQAEALYRQVLAASPDNFDASLGLFFALVESEQLEAAAAHIDGVAAALPARRHRDGLPNGEKLSAAVASDQARLYADRVAEAQQRIASRLAATPFNSEARQAEASLHLARGWQRQGEADLRRVIATDPRNAGLHADRAEALLSLQAWGSARAALADAQGLDPDHPRLRQAQETFALHDRRELYVEGAFGRGETASPYGLSDWHLDSWLYSRPMAETWRLFAHNYSASADFDSGRTHWLRTGVGVEWRAGDWRITGETNAGDGEKPGALATLRWQPDDYWKLYAAAESLTNDIPLQAVRAGVSASRVTLGADWRAHEACKLAVAATAANFSDGNQRRTLAATWFERWASGPRWLFETTLGGEASHNSLGYAAAYFNPPEDRSLWLAGAVEHLGWRHYEHTFRQRLVLTAGNYWQSGFASGSMAAVEYQQRWELGRDLSLRYGIGRSRHPYDGVAETRNFATMSLLWRF